MPFVLPAVFRRRFVTPAAASVLVGLLVMAGCGAAGPSTSSGAHGGAGSSVGATQPAGSIPGAERARETAAANAVLAPFGLAGLGAKDLIDRLDALPIKDRPRDLTASVRPGEVIVTGPHDATVSLPLPADEFYVSLAPYVDTTHPCHFHSLTTCRGELSDRTVDLTVRDRASGAVILDGSRTTFDNGFVGVWLPRDIDVDVTIGYEGRHASASVSTSGADAATCVTTLHLT